MDRLRGRIRGLPAAKVTRPFSGRSFPDAESRTEVCSHAADSRHHDGGSAQGAWVGGHVLSRQAGRRARQLELAVGAISHEPRQQVSQEHRTSLLLALEERTIGATSLPAPGRTPRRRNCGQTVCLLTHLSRVSAHAAPRRFDTPRSSTQCPQEVNHIGHSTSATDVHGPVLGFLQGKPHKPILRGRLQALPSVPSVSSTSRRS